MRLRPQTIRLTEHHTDLFLRKCPVPGCIGAAVCRLDWSGGIMGNCRACGWVGLFTDFEKTEELAAK